MYLSQKTSLRYWYGKKYLENQWVNSVDLNNKKLFYLKFVSCQNYCTPNRIQDNTRSKCINASWRHTLQRPSDMFFHAGSWSYFYHYILVTFKDTRCPVGKGWRVGRALQKRYLFANAGAWWISLTVGLSCCLFLSSNKRLSLSLSSFGASFDNGLGSL